MHNLNKLFKSKFPTGPCISRDCKNGEDGKDAEWAGDAGDDAFCWTKKWSPAANADR